MKLSCWNCNTKAKDKYIFFDLLLLSKMFNVIYTCDTCEKKYGLTQKDLIDKLRGAQ